MYKYEMHLHTAPVSSCARKTVLENLTFYKELGYDGVFITNHFVDGNLGIDRNLPYEEKLRFYLSDYEEGLRIGQEIGLKVFFGIENNFEGTHFLIYGLEPKWYLEHPEILDMKMSAQLAYLIEHGALVIHAHPFRSADRWIDHIRLFPKVTHGVEVINANRDEFTNKMAAVYAENYGFLTIGGTDNHLGRDNPALAGIETEIPINSEQELRTILESGRSRVFHMKNPLQNG